MSCYFKSYDFFVLGSLVKQMQAIDYDDIKEASNAKISYSIQKNVIDEKTGKNQLVYTENFINEKQARSGYVI